MSDEFGSISDEISRSNSEADSEEARQDDLIIDKIVHQLVTQGMPDNFVTSDIHGRVERIESMFSSCESLVTIQPMRLPKSNDESSKYDKFGDEEVSQGNYNKGLFLYNKSIAFAEQGSEYLHNLYVKRAFLLHQIKLFKASIHSLELAIKYGPSHLKELYEQRKEHLMREYSTSLSKEESINRECQNEINSFTKIDNDRKHPDVPFIINCLELNDTENYGRGIFTNSDLNPGDVVAIEKAYAMVLFDTYRYRHCSNCFKENWSLIPCPDCTTAMYCNQKCLQIAWQNFHKHQCGISNYLSQVFPERYLMYFKFASQTIELFGGIDPLIEFEGASQQMYGESFTVFDVNHEEIQYDDEGEFENYADNENFNSRVTPLNYHPVHGLLKDIAEPSNWTIKAYVRTAVFTLLMYRLFHDIFNITTNIQKRFVEKLIYRHILATLKNAYALALDRRKKPDICYGTALYPFISLINHSCAPNLIMDREGSSGTLIVLHPIKAGDQLFYHYGQHYTGSIKSERQSQLKSGWDFTCQCIACVEDYPLLPFMPQSCIPYERNQLWYDSPTNVKYKKLIKDLKALFMFRRSHEKFYPCWEICSYEYFAADFLSHFLRRRSGSVYMKC